MKSANKIQMEAMTDANPITNPRNSQILVPLDPKHPPSYISPLIYIKKIELVKWKNNVLQCNFTRYK